MIKASIKAQENAHSPSSHRCYEYHDVRQSYDSLVSYASLEADESVLNRILKSTRIKNKVIMLC